MARTATSAFLFIYLRSPKRFEFETNLDEFYKKIYALPKREIAVEATAKRTK